jgi:uncharacterized protein
MGKRTSYEPGTFSYVELATTDVADAKPFYSELFGWNFDEIDTGDAQPYWQIAHAAGAGGRNGGMRELTPDEQGIPPNWTAYFAVESVDEALTKAQELGGGVMFGPLEVPTGKFAALHDPQRAVFAVFEGQFDD